MALHYGFNITASDMKKLLEENDKQQSGVRSWRQLFGNASLGYEAQSSALRTDYGEAMAQAYKANLAQQNTVANLGLNAGATRAAVGATRADLMNAYNTYIANYNKDAATAAQNYSGEVSAIDTALNERAANFANLYSSAYKYLSEELYGSTRTRDGVTTNLFDDQELGWAYAKDANGNPTTELASWDELSRQLFNPDGSINEQGRKFFDQMFNQIPQGYMTGKGERMRGFDEWLSAQEDTFANYDATNLPGMAKTGRELRNWWVTQDDFNYTRAGTNKGTAQANVGLESTDTHYAPYQYTKPSDFKITTHTSTNDYGTLSSAASTALANFERFRELVSASGSSKQNKAYTDATFVAQENLYKTVDNEINALSTNYNNLVEQLKKNLSTPEYNELYKNNKELFDTVDRLLTEVKHNITSAGITRPEKKFGDTIYDPLDQLRENSARLQTIDYERLSSLSASYNELVALIQSYAAQRNKPSSGF